jgi:ketosteroid isomerase-like protein
MTIADAAVDRLQDIVGAFNANDADTLERLVSPEFDYRLEGSSPIAGRYCGHDGMRRFMQAIHGAAEGTLTVEPIAITADNDRWVIMYANVRAERGGKRLDSQNLYVYEFDGDKLRNGRNVPCDQRAWDAFWSH